MLTKEEKGVAAAKRWGRRMNLKGRKDRTMVAQQAMVATQMAWEIEAKANDQVGLYPGLAEAMLSVKQERIVAISPSPSSVSSVSSLMRPGTPSARAQVLAASRFASGAAPVQFNGAPIPDLNQMPRSGDLCPAATQKTRAVPEENMPLPV
jgi:beta-phosphoglucomutase-like phosphatase (HAD superfamily)